MKVLVKLGGTLLEEAGARGELARQLAMVRLEHALVVVHGGGKQVTRYLAERGVESAFVNGLRVSDDAVMDAVTKVIAGTVNQQIVSSLVAAGVGAVGLSGIDGPLTIAERLSPELGFVGRPVRTDSRLLNLLSDAGYVPTIACVAGGRNGEIFNVNADQMAVSCAADWGADVLLFLTDVAGVKGGGGERIERLTTGESRDLVRRGIAHGGMQAKLEAAEAAIERGVGQVIIASGWENSVCSRALAGEAVGTSIHNSLEAV